MGIAAALIQVPFSNSSMASTFMRERHVATARTSSMSHGWRRTEEAHEVLAIFPTMILSTLMKVVAFQHRRKPNPSQ